MWAGQLHPDLHACTSCGVLFQHKKLDFHQIIIIFFKFFNISNTRVLLKEPLVGSCGLSLKETRQKHNEALWSTCARLTSKDSKVGVMIEGDRLVAMLFQQTRTEALSL